MPTLTAVADLHGNLPTDLPAADLLVVAGDVCPISDHDPDFQAAWLEREFYPWLERLPFAEIAWIAGNHDFVCQREGWTAGGRGHYLLDEGDELCGLSIYGTPWVPALVGWAFYAEDDALAERIAAIPPVDVVLSHGPPRGYGDLTVRGINAGSEALGARLAEIEPRACIFGHIHEAYGRWRLGTTELLNVSYVDEGYQVRPGAAVRLELDAGEGGDP